MNWLLAAAAAPVAAVGGWIGWRWYSTGRAPSMADVIPFARRSPDAVINTWAEKNDVDPALVRGVLVRYYEFARRREPRRRHHLIPKGRGLARPC